MSRFRTRNASTPGGPLLSRLGAYSAGAVTGALSIASSDAAVVYVNANQFITDPFTNDSSYTTRDVDFNGDTVPDLQLWTRDATGSADRTNNDAFIAAPDGIGLSVSVVGQSNSGYLYPARLAAGAMIDGSAGLITLSNPPGQATVGWLADSDGFPGSQFKAAPNNTGYVGVRFIISGYSHFGWMRITVTPQGGTGTRPRSITLHEFAYESDAGASIEAGVIPEPGGLGLLALGSIGLAAHRRRRIDPPA